MNEYKLPYNYLTQTKIKDYETNALRVSSRNRLDNLKSDGVVRDIIIRMNNIEIPLPANAGFNKVLAGWPINNVSEELPVVCFVANSYLETITAYVFNSKNDLKNNQENQYKVSVSSGEKQWFAILNLEKLKLDLENNRIKDKVSAQNSENEDRIKLLKQAEKTEEKDEKKDTVVDLKKAFNDTATENTKSPENSSVYARASSPSMYPPPSSNFDFEKQKLIREQPDSDKFTEKKHRICCALV